MDHHRHRPPGVHPAVGATLPGGARVHLVTLNGFPVRYTLRDTNAGRDVLVSTSCSGRTWQVHIVAS